MLIKKLLIRPAAIADLEKIYSYSHREFGSKRAEKYIRDLRLGFGKITKNPKAGHDFRYSNLNLKSYRVVSHIVFYEILQNKIAVVRILHKSMDYKKHILCLQKE